MAITTPKGEQIQFVSAKTGTHNLDTYLEAAEHGNRQLHDLLDDLFDASTGAMRNDIFEFRYNPNFNSNFSVIQARNGQHASADAGWDTVTTFFKHRGAFSASNAYNNYDFVIVSNSDVYMVNGLAAPFGGIVVASEAAFISNSHTVKIIDVSGAQSWAVKVDGAVSGTGHSSKAWAVGGTGVTDTASKGAAKEWATKTSGTVDGTSYSAKYWATVGNVATVVTNIADINTLAASGAQTNINTVVGSITNVNNVGGSIANVNIVGGNISNVNSLSNALGTITTFAITVASVGGSNKFHVDGTAAPVMSLFRGNTYIFDLSNSSNSGHPLVFKTSAGAAYTTGVVTSGTAGTANAKVTFIIAADAPAALVYSCSVHGNGMGNTITVATNSLSTVASSIGNVNIAAGNISNINTVAGISTAVSAAAGNAAAAANSASLASSSQSAAASSAASAATAFDSFDDRYLGAKSSNPSVDNDGASLVVGALYFKTGIGMHVYDGSSWLLASSAGTASMNEFKYTATAGQTVFTGSDGQATLSYVLANVIVTMNGIVLENGTDYTASNGTSVVLAVAAAVSDEVNILAFKSFTLADMVSKTNGGTFGANIGVTGNITVSGNVDGRDISTDGTKLDGIETSATADQTAAEIKTLVGNASDSNVLTDASLAKINAALPNTGGAMGGNLTFGTDTKISMGDAGDTNLLTQSGHTVLKNVTYSKLLYLNAHTIEISPDTRTNNGDNPSYGKAVSITAAATRLKDPAEPHVTKGFLLTADASGVTMDSNLYLSKIEKLSGTGPSYALSGTAVDVFVYDTSKDSDGGAWRHRTQHTSWYNENASHTRGFRRDFPAVALIVADNVDHRITIYDSDNPDLPMWMVFTDWNYRPTNRMIGSGDNGTITASLSMLNGKFVVGVEGATGSSGSWDGLFEIDFLKDHAIHRNVTTTTYGVWDGNISTRNTGKYPAVNAYTVPAIVNAEVNDVAMTVLPNAPIDPATGLPVPTIAVGTAGGTSIIRDDGIVVDITTSNASYTSTHSVKFKDGGVYNQFGQAGNSAYSYYYIFNTIPTADTQISLNTLTATGQNPDAYGTANSNITARTFSLLNSGVLSTVLTEIEPSAAGGAKGLTMLSGNLGVKAQNQVAFITSDYNTGWLVGDTKLATLAETTTSVDGSFPNVTGAELVANGTFASNTTGWTAGVYSTGSAASLSIVSGKLRITSAGATYGAAHQTITTVVGKTYVATADFTKGTASGYMWIGTTLHAYNNGHSGLMESTQTKVMTFVATGTTTYVNLILANSPSNGTSDYDNVSVRIAEPDRSVNGNGLQVFGTITKAGAVFPVGASTGQLVAYSGFSASNYLQQPYNAGLSFGTGGYSFICWFKKPSNAARKEIVSRGTADSTESMRIGVSNAGVYFDYGSSSAYAQTNLAVNLAVWNCLVCTVKAGANGHVYLNGIEQTYSSRSVAPSTFLTGTDYDLTIGQSHGGAIPWEGSLALLRLSGTVPSPEQITKIYNDEKFLFQNGASADLFGTSSTVTALAHDDATGELHVGTSAGRSVFQGLRRISNTTEAVGSTISAENGLVAED